MLEKKLLNFRPFLFTAISLALGIGAGYFFYFNDVLWGIILVVIFLALIALAVLFTGGEIKSKLIFSIAFIMLFSFGAGSFNFQLSEYDNANLEGHTYTVTGKITSVVNSDYGQQLILEDVNIKGNRMGKLRYNISLLIYGDSNYDIGEIISFDGTLQDMNSMYEDRISATNIERGIKYTAVLDSEKVSKVGVDASIFEKIHIIFRNSIKSGMDEREATVAYGLLLGNTDEMNADVIGSYRSAGVAHIFAVSGLHIGFLATALSYLFKKCKNRLIKAILITLTLFFYSGVCGFSASSLRASVMSAVLLFSAIRGNRYDGLSSVGVACTLILTCSPINLFCVGFQLSFGVVIGIILLSSPIAKLFKLLPKKLASSLGTVISAQIVGIPICLYAFQEFSTIAILANLIFIPIVGFVFIFLFVGTIVGGLLSISKITLFLPNYIFVAINAVITAIDYEIFIVGGFTFGILAIFYYLALVLSSGIINLNKIVKIVATLVCIVTCVIGTVVINVKEASTPKAYVVGDEKACATVIKNDGENIMIINDVERVFSLNRFKRLSYRESITNLDALIFTQTKVDLQLVVTRLNQVFELDKVFYYGMTDLELEESLRKSFNVNVRAFVAGEKLALKTDCSYALNGYAVECSINGNNLVAISKFGNYNAGYKGLDGEYDYMIATDYVDFIYKEYSPQEFISYKDSLQFRDAYSSGMVKISLK